MREQGRTARLLLSAAIPALLAVALYWPATGFDFVNLDDNVYVTENPPVREGLSVAGAGWALTTLHAGYWIPVTWLSLMLDATVHGANAGGYHLTNLLLHAAGAALFFLLLGGLTGTRWPSVAVAAVFAVHPLHVESVAWITERKDVLSTFLLLLAFLSWMRHLRRGRGLPGSAGGSRVWYRLAVVLFCLSLAAKPMTVTFPLLLLFLDRWPLGRDRRMTWAALVKEKWPFLFAAAGAGILTLLAHRSAGALAPLWAVSAIERIGNLVVSALVYPAKVLWPSGLAVLYPLPGGGYPAWVVAVSLAFLAWVIAVALRWRSYPALAVGLLWYLAALLPVSGVLQAGEQVRADRFVYLPMLGLYLAAVPAIDRLRRRGGGAPVALVGALLVAVLALVARRQLDSWQDSETLFRHALAVAGESVTARVNLGETLAGQGRDGEALEQYRAALRLAPGDPQALENLGNALLRLGREEEGRGALEKAADLDPSAVKVRLSLAFLALRWGDEDRAERHLREVVALAPDFALARAQLGQVLALRGDPAGAAREFDEALRLDPGDEISRHNLAVVLDELRGPAGKAGESRRGMPGETLGETLGGEEGP